MFIAAHVAAGALIGQTLGDTNPALIFSLSFASHFLLDVIPHGDRRHVVDYFHEGKQNVHRFYRMLKIDITVSLIMIAWLMLFTKYDHVHMAWGIVGSAIPDLLVGLGEHMGWSLLKKFVRMHFKIHNALIHKIIVKPWSGAIVQAFLITAMLAAL